MGVKRGDQELKKRRVEALNMKRTRGGHLVQRGQRTENKGGGCRCDKLRTK